jgi:hypothetical protein
VPASGVTMFAYRSGLGIEDLRKVMMAQLWVIPLSGRDFPWESFFLVHQSGASLSVDEIGICIERVPAHRSVVPTRTDSCGKYPNLNTINTEKWLHAPHHNMEVNTVGLRRRLLDVIRTSSQKAA